MFRSLDDTPPQSVEIWFDGKKLAARTGQSVAAALLCHTNWVRRSQGLGTRRGPYCMMGVCFDCLVSVDGVPGQRACMTMVKKGMVVERQTGAPAVMGTQ